MSGGTSPGALQLGLRHGMVVQELGWDSDVDEEFRTDVMELIDADLVEEASAEESCGCSPPRWAAPVTSPRQTWPRVRSLPGSR